MKRIVAAAALLLTASLPAGAAALCNCCGSGTSRTCEAACAAVSPSGGQCQAAVDYAGMSDIGPGQNPLYEMSLNNLEIGAPSRIQLEQFRKLLEQARLGAESDRRAALADRRSGKIDDAAAAALAKRYDDAMVNYYLGLQAYRNVAQRKNLQ